MEMAILIVLNPALFKVRVSDFNRVTGSFRSISFKKIKTASFR
jgi:hypothetical protein